MSRNAESVSGAACAKFILLGEHAVVYGQPAIAFPVAELQATARVHATATAGVVLQLSGATCTIDSLRQDSPHPLAQAVVKTLQWLQEPLPACRITLASSIPQASGLGSGTAVTLALIRALARFCQRELPPDEQNHLVDEIETLFHGYPSGIDSKVITYARPLFFRQGISPVFLALRQPLLFVLADTGISCPTRDVVEELRQRALADPATYFPLFGYIGVLAEQGKEALSQGNLAALGSLINENQSILQTLKLSSPCLDACIAAACAAGAYGAKLSGGGRGGICLALVSPESQATVEKALRAAGAVQTYAVSLAPDWRYQYV